ncbi:MAG: DNA repair protein RadC [Flavobacteriaceae bacterium]|nr:DNA repair protein RadC [Flavobacteriaceae bacterium]
MGGNSISFSIKTWNEDDRPREKLLVKGPSSLSDAELIAILIGSGNKSESAVALSKRILSQSGNSLKELGKKSIPDLLEFYGIGEAKAITILAAMELGRRRQAENVLDRRRITSSHMAFEFLRPMLSDLHHEEFWAVYLNNSNKVLQTHQLSKGGITGTVVDVRLTMKTALQLSAVGIILAHNHPSGTLVPSEADKQLTKKFIFAGNSLDIKILDHLIITEKTYFSFADEQLL